MTTVAAYKAQDYRRAQFGPDVNKRIAAMREWTKRNPGQPRSTNPFYPPNYYSEAQVFRAVRFAEWQTANPERPYSENPHGWLKPN